MLLQTVPLWITETAPPHGRGVLSTLHAMMAAVGYLAAAYVGVGFFYYQNANGQQWRAPLAIGCLFPLVNLALMPILPESPRFLLTKEHTQRAWKVVERLRRTDDSSYESSHREFEEMKRQIELDRTLDSSWRVLLTRPSYRKRVLIACLTLSMIYSSGTLVVSSKPSTNATRLRQEKKLTSDSQTTVPFCSPPSGSAHQRLSFFKAASYLCHALLSGCQCCSLIECLEIKSLRGGCWLSVSLSLGKPQ